jgi:hypothetical protein
MEMTIRDMKEDFLFGLHTLGHTGQMYEYICMVQEMNYSKVMQCV